MKYSVALVSAFAAASVAGPIETRQNRKPFVEVPDDAFFIQEKKKNYNSEGEPFDSIQDCFRSRETPAFHEVLSGRQRYLACDANAYDWNDFGKSPSEACLGTIEWCNQKIYENDGEPFDSPKDCIDSRKTAQSGANTQVSKGDDVRQKQAEYCTNNKLGLQESACKILVAQCAFENQDATSFDAIAECVESRV
ncbi:hypothetical protein MY4038_005171 [Beauveria bassiana]